MMQAIGARVRAWVNVGASLAALIGAAGAASCDNQPKQKPVQAATVIREVPEPLRGTIGSLATIRGVDPQLVAGLGFVVGLNGTGGGELSPQVQATMERELAKGGLGKGGLLDNGPLQGRSPRDVLRDPNVAVVVVEAAISPGWPKDYTFDVRVRTLPGTSSVSSLEGGTLWTTELRIGPASTVGAVRTRVIAEARGPIFINPFAEPGTPGADAVSRTVGRVLAGGTLTEPLQMELVLDNPSHATARAIASAINSRFPEGPLDEGPTARGRNGDSVALRVPRAYADRPGEFVEMVRCLQLDQTFPQEFARRYVEDLKAMPFLSDDLSWCLQATGKAATAFLPPLYDYPEAAPRMAALRAGAALGDPRTAASLIQMAESGPPTDRIEAIGLLARLPINPRINSALWAMIDEPELDVRVAAYEALRDRGDPGIVQIPVDDRFVVDIVPSKEGLVYVTQQGEPRIVLFGGGVSGATATSPGKPTPMGPKLEKPLLVMAWQDRLMMAAETPTSPVRLRYMDYRGGNVTNQTVSDYVVDVIDFLGHRTTPESPAPGLGLPYSEVVGAVYEINRQGGMSGGFATERDKLLATVLKAAKVTTVEDRPETTGAEVKESPVQIFDPATTEAAKREEAAGPKPSLVVPLTPSKSKAKE
ncbi:MAG: flagellar basal body P-ring protein FlgI [Phycisphaeraceae bacterium]|nr:flagellar basal body P-ring protein FlgI [Phycisphaeraceae bacterium]